MYQFNKNASPIKVINIIQVTPSSASQIRLNKSYIKSKMSIIIGWNNAR